jgi:hypothetical protein
MIHKIVVALLPDTPADRRHKLVVEDTVIFVEGQINRMPEYLRWGFRIMLLVLDFSSIPRYGLPFRFTSEDSRRRQLERWRGSRLRFQRDFVRLVSASALLRYYDHELMNSSNP